MAVTRHGHTLLARVYGPAVPSEKILTGWGERSYINVSSTAQQVSAAVDYHGHFCSTIMK
jgi:hypothetical protein